ncbi:MAG: peptidoglycan DD-metalloendopeptidase family protein, partial [Paracraurococcus sp.]
ARDAAREAAALEAAARARAQEAAARTVAPPPAGRGARPMPVAGQVSREFGAGGEGDRSRGMTLAALPGASVVSPCGGKVVFGSSFRSYGLLLIVDCGDGYHFVLAGLDRLDVAPGQRVLAGEPVGRLGSGAGAGSGRVPLYLELRRKGQPVDPRTWFAAKG